MAFINKGVKAACAAMLATGLAVGASTPASADYFEAFDHVNYRELLVHVEGNPTVMWVPQNRTSSIKNQRDNTIYGRNNVMWGVSTIEMTANRYADYANLWEASDKIDYFTTWWG
ncbi:hypothetical protein [Falsarthrobacter nasiphocae]|uniref:Uncharacterized protein n=1 Tax=Falsarthrobacter nasiphocae TaxID=189863 RepID=A0AAE4C6B2_9MICC|nr:hypothetical protein [Falsarthrobacter nasiphocae]MDR6891967.1 hypothetical protein [Falsarthrobacter nasiphocae]